MPPTVAAIVCWIGIAGLFYLDRNASARTSKAVWLPVIWFLLVGSRPVSAWLGITPTGREQVEGSPTDALVFFLLLAGGLLVLIRRSSQTRALLRRNGPILVYFGYCLVSVLWAVYPDIAFKKWFKAIGDLVMVLVIVTDGEPIAAFRRLVSHTGFVLLPTSVLYMKYFDGLRFDPSGDLSVVGVTTNKNTLGVVVLVLSLGTLWHVLSLLRDGRQRGWGRRLLAQSTLLAFGGSLLVLAKSATCIACFPLGGILILASSLPAFRRRPVRVHGLMLLLLFTAATTMLAGGGDSVVHTLGKQSNLSGRTDIWNAVIPAAPNAVIGAGFESFWISPEYLAKVVHYLNAIGWWHPEGLNTAHNGYIEVYLNLGWVGVSLIALILINGYWQAYSAFRRQPEIGGLMLAYVPVAALYSVTEAGFRMMDPIWIFLLLAIVFAGGISEGFVKIQPFAQPGRPQSRDERQPLGWTDPLLTR